MAVNKKCQVFTPSKNVAQLLDVIGYSKNLYGKKIAETSCGDGNILVEIVDRYIQDSLQGGLLVDEIKRGLENDVWASEIDSEHIATCQVNLNNVACKYNIFGVMWNIVECDFLKQFHSEKFDFIVSNPPYITYRDLEQETRIFVKENYTTCSIGKFDYCYAFIEAGLNALKHTGKMAYLIPSNIFKNQFGFKLREYILPSLTNIYDFTNQKLFSKHLTASAIIICDKNSKSNRVCYHNLSNNTSYNISKKSLRDKWIFTKPITHLKDSIRFGDYFHAASSIATLLNRVYIISDYIEDGQYLVSCGKKIEKTVLRKAVSPRSLYLQQKEYLLFPYCYDDNNNLKRYSVEEFESLFPEATNYLKTFKAELEQRTSDDASAWFEYGRSQALSHMNKHKLLLSTLVTGKVKVSMWDESTIPTSGIYIICKDDSNQCSLSQAQNVLDSDEFLEYIYGIGIISGGNSLRITSKDINNFVFPSRLL